MYYFDNAATTFPKPEIVYETMDKFYRSYGVNVGRGMFREASVAAKLMDETRKLMLELFHSTADYSCIFTASATEAINLILQGMEWNSGKTVYISPFEHNAVLRTLHAINQKYGAAVKEIAPDREFFYDYGKIREAFRQAPPSVVVLSHASNAFGFINPVGELFKIAKEFGAVTVCDMAQTAGLIDTNIVQSHIDYAVFAGHKTLYGPLGISGFVTNQKCVLRPLIYGGTGIDSKNPDMPEEMPTKYEGGSHNILSISGLNAALKWIQETRISHIFEQEKAHTARLLNILKEHKNIHVIRCADEGKNIGVISCMFDGYSSDSIGQVLSEQGIAVRTGLHCAPRAHEFLRTAPDGTIRFSLSYFTDDESFFALEKALTYIEENG